MILRITTFLCLLTFTWACSSPEAERMEAFDSVCRIIAERFYDPGFNGHDWDALAEQYRPRVAAAEDDERFYLLMNEMLFELGVSHIALIPDEHPEWIGAPAVFADGEVGIDVRLVDDAIIVISVRPGSPGAEAGIRPGAELLRIDGQGLEEIRTQALEPPTSPLDERLKVTQALQQGLFGPTGETTTFRFANFGEAEREVTLTRVERPGRSTIIEGIPPSFLEFEAYRIEGKIGYLRFNAFDTSLLERIHEAIDAFMDTIGLVIDLRGNPGGTFQVRRGLAERLILEPCTIWTQNGRRGPMTVDLEPQPNAYMGVIVVLTDLMSCSSAEELSGGLQALGRARVVGEKTTGVVLVADVIRLDIGATLVYPVAETALTDGSTLEGVGVTPDFEVVLDRASLAAGRDLPLEAAVRLIKDSAGSSAR